MNLDEIIRAALCGQVVLFAGSGFNYGAKNVCGRPFITAEDLCDKLAKKCGYTKSKMDLSRISEIYKKKVSPEELIKILKDEFTVKEVAPHHGTVMSVPWHRVYTTNYDRVIELAAEENETPMTPVTMSDRVDRTIKDNVCVHVNGFIDRLNTETLDREFKLTNRSYNAESLVGKPYFEQMKSDFRTMKFVVVIGFSMQYDLDITRVIAQPEMKKKTVFIVGDTIEDDEYDYISEYALCEKIGIQGIASKIENIKKKGISTFQPTYYKNFIHEYRKECPYEELSYEDIVRFYYAGIEHRDIYSKDATGEYRYLVSRAKLSETVRRIYEIRLFLILSRLGNGKSIFLSMLRHELSKTEVHVYTYKRGGMDWAQDVENIVRQKGRKVVIIDNYISVFEVLEHFQRLGSDGITFVLTERRSVNAKAYPRLQQTLKLKREEIQLCYLDTMDGTDLRNLAGIFAGNGILSSKFKSDREEDIVGYLTDNCNGEFVNILLDLFNSSDIRNRLSQLYSNKKGISSDVYEMCVFALVRAMFNINIDDYCLFEFFNVNYVTLSNKEIQFINELLNITENSIGVRSSIVAKELLIHVIDFQQIVDVMIRVFREGNKRLKSNPIMQEMLKNILSHSNFLSFKNRENFVDGVVRYYDEIKNEEFCVGNPFFWEQFASAYIDMRQYESARSCIQTAYAIAKGKRGFIPYQIDTVNGRCIMEEMLDEGFEHVEPNFAISQFRECHATLMEHYTAEGNNAYYTFLVGGKYARYYEKFRLELDNRGISIFIQCSTEMLRKMDEYLKDGIKIYDEKIEVWKKSLEEILEKAKKDKIDM